MQRRPLWTKLLIANKYTDAVMRLSESDTQSPNTACNCTGATKLYQFRMTMQHCSDVRPS